MIFGLGKWLQNGRSEILSSTSYSLWHTDEYLLLTGNIDII